MYDVIIIGGGTAGLMACIYVSRAKLRVLVLEEETFGGQVMNIDWVENYLGYENGLSGAELGSKMVTQAMNCGAELKLAKVNRVELRGEYEVVKTNSGDYLTRSLIIAGGAHPRRLGVPGEEEFANRGVFYCAACDGGHFANKVVAVAGGGDAGITEGLYLTRIVSKVIIIELMPALTATKILEERAFANPKMEIYCGTKIEAILGDTGVRTLGLLNMETGERSTLVAVDGVLVHVGLEANTDCVKGILALDNEGQIMVNDHMETNVQGIFAAGDIRHNSARQIVAAAGDGAIAALSAVKFLAGSTPIGSNCGGGG